MTNSKFSAEEAKKQLLSEKRHDFESLRLLVEVLRGPEGCAWDRIQTHESIRSDIIEETYEVVEAIDREDPELLREELGDVFFQVLFHSRIEEETGRFSIDDVINDITEKMIRRHPHVFGDVLVKNAEEVLDNWEANKVKEKSRETLRDILDAVPKQYPSLMRAKKVVKKARKNASMIPDEVAERELPAAEENINHIIELASKAGTADQDERDRIAAEMIYAAVLMSSDGADLERDIARRTDRLIDDVAGKKEKVKTDET